MPSDPIETVEREYEGKGSPLGLIANLNRVANETSEAGPKPFCAPNAWQTIYPTRLVNPELEEIPQ